MVSAKGQKACGVDQQDSGPEQGPAGRGADRGLSRDQPVEALQFCREPSRSALEPAQCPLQSAIAPRHQSAVLCQRPADTGSEAPDEEQGHHRGPRERRYSV